MEVRENPKSEYRNPKQIRIFKIPNLKRFDHWRIRILNLFRVSCFGFRVLLIAITFFISISLYAQQGPFPLRTQQPLYLQTVTILPARAEVLDTGLFTARVDSAYSNLYERETGGGNDINLDMELWRLAWVAQYGFAPAWEIDLEIPTLHFEGGFLDSFIQDFHDAFGFPNGGRESVANGTFNYRVTRNGLTYTVGQQSLDVGDLTVTLKNQILAEGEGVPALAWLFAMKFPSGDADLGLGSGNLGFGLGLALEKSYRRLHGYLNLNFLVDGGNDSLEDVLHKEFFDFSLAGEFEFSKKVSALVQFVGGTPRLKGTGLETWDGVPLDFIVGARGSEGKFFWQAAFSEDIRAVGPSVDFTTWISIGVRFGATQLYQGDFLARKF